MQHTKSVPLTMSALAGADIASIPTPVAPATTQPVDPGLASTSLSIPPADNM
ncbi:MAG TPA: hypothetical protein VI455_08990 [Terriglobia bacterium]